ncbi:MAG: ATP phosphoribosyltransferase regulatory subunit [Candidatus Pacebacteria bacterium]|nr:ATP phosphoribosyltransferase regulatory subunit [Candidatus Paceibacterota bacterium]
MNIQKLKGFRDYEPKEMILRNHILNLLKETFESFGYEPFDTPALEYTEIILGKSGKENDKLIYSFKDNGDRDIALRYDLTVPLARYICENKGILKPFKRYQIGKVWRADKPQKGRYREFEQADIDVVGSDSYLIEIELILAFSKFLQKLNLSNFVVQINSREILQNALNTSGIKKEE